MLIEDDFGVAFSLPNPEGGCKWRVIACLYNQGDRLTVRSLTRDPKSLRTGAPEKADVSAVAVDDVAIAVKPKWRCVLL